MTLAGHAAPYASRDHSASNPIQIFTPLSTLTGLLVFLGLHRFNPYTTAIAYTSASIPAFGLMAYPVRRVFLRAGGRMPIICNSSSAREKSPWIRSKT